MSAQRSLLVLLALGLPAAVARAEDDGAAVKVEDVRSSPEEQAAFEATFARFRSRMAEFEADVKDIVQQQESLERSEVVGSYKSILSDLEEDNRALRATAIRRFEEFLDKYPHAEHTPHVMFRLAELYFEQSEEAWSAKDEEYRRLLDSMTDDQLAEAPEEPHKDFHRSIRLYERILRDYPDYQYLDGCYYMLGYILSEPSSEQYDEEAGLAQFQALVDRFPDSRFAAAAHLRIGEYYFDYAQGAEDLRKAIPHYQAVVDIEGPEGRLYDEGLYKLAWSYYKLSEYDKALSLLNALLDWSNDIYFNETGKHSPMEPEAIEYTAISFSDVSERQGRSPIAVAEAFYEQVGHRDFEDKVYKRLADVLTQQARYAEAIDVYRYIQDRWPNDPENPDFQWKVAALYLSLPVPDRQGAQEAIAELNRRYNDDSSWWQANRNNPDALAVARKYIEDSLATVAIQYHSQAMETGNVEDYAKAADLYEQYLTKFPFAEDYYQIQWWLADTLYKSGQLERALAQYEQLRKGGRHNYKEGALWMVMQIRKQLLTDRYGAVNTRPPDAEVDHTVDLPSGKQRTVYKVDEEHATFIAVCDELVKSDFHEAEQRIMGQLAEAKDAETKKTLQDELEQVQAYAAGLDQFRPALAYLPAQILYAYGRFDEARPRLQDIIARWPERDEAAYSASLIVDSYLEEEDLVNVRKYAQKFASMRLGQSTTATQKTFIFQDQAEGATFNLAMKLIEQGKYEEAAEAFLDFIEEFPASKYRKDALYNAANNYEKVGKVAEANRLFERYVQENPEDERSRPLYFRLAGNYASALELDKAVQYYEALYENTKGKGIDYADAPAALFNAGFLRIGLGDHRGAALDFERYARENPDQPDAEQVLFMAGEQWEQVSDEDALRFYRRYVRQYPDLKPDHVIEAYHRIVEIEERIGTPKQVDRAWDDLSAAYERLAATGQVGPAGRHYAAHAEFRKLEADLEAFKEIHFTKDDDKNADLLLNVKKNALTDIVDRAEAIVTRYQDFEYSSAALYVAGLAYLYYSDMLYQAPCPQGFDEEACMIYAEQIDEIRIPVEDKGRARLEAILDTARQQHDWSEWQTRALEELNRRYPLEFAKEKQEFRGEGESAYVPMAGPLSPPAGDGEAEAAAPAADAASPPADAASPPPAPEAGEVAP